VPRRAAGAAGVDSRLAPPGGVVWGEGDRLLIPRLAFGKTGHDSSRVVFGAAALMSVSQDEADRVLERLLAAGVNHIDVASSYGDAELRVGPWMAEHRGDFFLATKTKERSYAAARDEIRSSLERLRVDQVDLIQLHNLVKEDEWEVAMGDDGVLRAAIEARDEGLVRFIGVTGHGTRVAGMHARSLERFDFASVLLPYNFSMMSQPTYAAEFEALVSECAERGVAVQTIKSVARRRWREEERRTTTTWYHAFEDPEELALAVRWVLARPGIFLNTASDPRLLGHTLDAAASYFAETPEAPSDAEMQALHERLAVEALFIRGHAAEITTF
jgi:aryl-alcohol dehydrogenase-like predicted oxidoreductase